MNTNNKRLELESITIRLAQLIKDEVINAPIGECGQVYISVHNDAVYVSQELKKEFRTKNQFRPVTTCQVSKISINEFKPDEYKLFIDRIDPIYSEACLSAITKHGKESKDKLSYKTQEIKGMVAGKK